MNRLFRLFFRLWLGTHLLSTSIYSLCWSSLHCLPLRKAEPCPSPAAATCPRLCWWFSKGNSPQKDFRRSLETYGLSAPGQELLAHFDTGAGGFSLPQGVEYLALQVPEARNTPPLHCTPPLWETAVPSLEHVSVASPLLFRLSCTGVRKGRCSSIHPGEQSGCS